MTWRQRTTQFLFYLSTTRTHSNITSHHHHCSATSTRSCGPLQKTRPSPTDEHNIALWVLYYIRQRLGRYLLRDSLSNTDRNKNIGYFDKTTEAYANPAVALPRLQTMPRSMCISKFKINKTDGTFKFYHWQSTPVEPPMGHTDTLALAPRLLDQLA